MHNFNRIRKAWKGFKFPFYGNGELAQTDQNSLAFFGLTGNTNMTGSTSPAATLTAPVVGRTTSEEVGGDDTKDKLSFKDKMNNAADKIGLTKDGKITSGAADLMASAAQVGASQVNKNMYYSDSQNQLGKAADALSSIPGFGPAFSLAKSGFNFLAAGLGSELDKFSMDQGVVERIGGGYSGAIANMNKAQQASGKTAIFGAHREGSENIAKAQTQMGIMANIDADNQNRLAMGANTQLNNLRYGQTLNGGLDARYLRAAKAGIKLEHLNRIKHLKIKQIVNVDTKQIEEFKEGGKIEEFVPTITEPISTFKEGGIIDFIPTIYSYTDPIETDVEFIPIIPEEIVMFKDGGKSGKKPKTRTIEELIEYAKAQNPRFIQRMSEPLRYIRINTKDEDGKESWGHATHEMNYRDNVVYPMVQEVNGKLHLFDNPETAYANAVKNSNVLTFDDEDEAKLFSISGIDDQGNYYGYKLGWQDFFNLSPVGIAEEYSVNRYKEGGQVKESEELVKLEETSQKNVIPEGVLHKNKHHIENTEGLTQKGIPVIDNDGEQQAEIELNEIIFTLEVTKKLEELHKIYNNGSNKERDDAAIEAGKLLVHEILYNTDDRTGLISKCQKGGKING